MTCHFIEGQLMATSPYSSFIFMFIYLEELKKKKKVCQWSVRTFKSQPLDVSPPAKVNLK